MSTSPEVELAAGTERALDFLRRALREGRYALDCRGPDGAPRFSHGKGHLFVAHFLADALAGTLDEIERTILLTRILSEERSGHWGFSPGDLFCTPEQATFVVDADDTAYVLRTLRGLGALRMPDALLAYRAHLDGGYFTFRAQGALSNEPRVAFEPSFANNLAIHPEVTFNVFTMLRATNYECEIGWPIVEQFQHASGWWHSYFYPGPYFGTLLAAEFLRNDAYYRPHLARTGEFLRQSQGAQGSWGAGNDPFATALALRALAAIDPADTAIGRGAQFLLRSQTPDGSWQSDAVVWRFTGAANDEWIATDRDRALTTALAATALQRVRRDARRP